MMVIAVFVLDWDPLIVVFLMPEPFLGISLRHVILYRFELAAAFIFL